MNEDRTASPTGTGTEPPVPIEHSGVPIAVTRSFAFVDITGFTTYCDRHGEHAAIEVLTRFRGLVRDITARRGVRVAKWLGDGAMLVGVDEGPLIASVAELVLRSPAAGIDTHAGLASGTVLFFEGDDYVGRPANLASRLCDVAEPGEILAHSLHGELPRWIEVTGRRAVEVTGMGGIASVVRLGVREQTAVDAVGDGAAALITGRRSLQRPEASPPLACRTVTTSDRAGLDLTVERITDRHLVATGRP